MLRLINIALLLGFLLCYLEWGGGNSGFVWQMEYELFTKKGNTVQAFLHPFVLVPFIGQLMLLYNALAPRPRRGLTLAGLLLLYLLVLMILFIGVFFGNWKIILSTIPYLFVSVFFFFWKARNIPSDAEPKP